MKSVTLPDLKTLLQRAIDLYAAREVLRALEWQRKANRGARQTKLFKQLADPARRAPERCRGRSRTAASPR